MGKSTLFNRFIESRKALVSNLAGTTRDRNEENCLWRGKIIRVVDTGGLDVSHTDEIERNTIKQAELAMAQADVILFVVDLKTGPMPQEQQLARKLRKSAKPVLVVGNKAETPALRNSVNNPEWRLAGFPAPIPVSALRGTGSGDLLDAVYAELKKMKLKPADLAEIKPIRVSVIGKPNVGKSSILNSLLGEERFIVSSIAHTTREPIDTLVEVGSKEYLLIDTAGVRKLNKVRKARGIENVGVEKTMETLKHTDVALFVVDASEPLGSQDRTLAGMCKEARVGVILIANKWDKIPNKTPDIINNFKRYIAGTLPYLSWAPVLFTSAITGQRITNIFDMVDAVQRARYTEIPQEELDAFLARAVRAHPPTQGKGPAPPKILGVKQFAVAPPSFHVTIKAKRGDAINESYLRYLENRLHDTFGYEGTGIVLKPRLPREIG